MNSFWVPEAQGHLRYHHLDGEGPPLLFIHGLGCASSHDYPTVAAHPVLRGRRIVLIDLLGSGFSDRPYAFGYQIEDHARSIVALIDSLGFAAFDLFGHSMGGAIAITAATALGGRLRRLIVSEPSLGSGGGTYTRRIASQSEEDYLGGGHDAVIQANRAEGNESWAATLTASAPFAIHREASSLMIGRDPTWRSLFIGLDAHRTLIIGEHSLPYADADGVSQAGVGIQIVPQAGHSMAWENPAGLAQAIAAGFSSSNT